MSEAAGFVIIRDGRKRYFTDDWSGPFLFRELIWGANDLELWLDTGGEVDQWVGGCDSGVVVNHDTKVLTWYSGSGLLDRPRVESVHGRLLQSAWPGFRIDVADGGILDLARAFGEPIADLDADFQPRPETVSEAIGQDDEDDWRDDEFGDEVDRDFTRPEFVPDDPTAWVTVIERGGNVRHHCLFAVPVELLHFDSIAMKELIALPAVEAPPENCVAEGMWIDRRRKEIGFWGGSLARQDLATIEQNWTGWSVRWSDDGYAEQCQVSGLPGIPMTDAEALGQILPHILSTTRFDVQFLMNTVADNLKRTAIRAVGCLVFVLSIPILIFGYFLEAMQAAWISIGVLIVVTTILIRIVVAWVKRSLNSGPFDQLNRNGDPDDDHRPVAGPLDAATRRQRLDGLLSSNGFPSIRELEPSFADDFPSGFDTMIDG